MQKTIPARAPKHIAAVTAEQGGSIAAKGRRSKVDFQKVVDSIGAMTCVVSVKKLENGGHGEIRIVTGNRA